MYKQKLADNTWKTLNGNVEFSPTVFQPAESLSDEQRKLFNVYEVTPAAQPNVNHTFNVVEGDPDFIDGQWVQTWIVSDATPEEIIERTNEQSDAIRANRNSLISRCDWTQLPDAPLTTLQKADWSEYRQKLRDIPQQTGFPWVVEWPQKPE